MRTAPDLADAIDLAKSGQESMVRCEAHDDGTASLHVAPGTSQPVVLTCHAGCEVPDILAAADVPFDAIMAEPDPNMTRVENEWTPAGDASHVYRYLDADGNERFQVLRVPLPGGKKTFRQRHRGPDGRWVWNMQDVERILYRLPDVLKAKAEGRTIYVVEGEKDVEALRIAGEVATTSPMGAGKWREEYNETLAGANVVIIPDADATGRAHARQVREALIGVGCTVSVKETAAGTKDIFDHLAEGGTVDTLIETVPEVEEKQASYGVDVLDIVVREKSKIEFVVPNVLAKGDRLLLTGLEGHGKSLWLRQFATQVAAGIHPFTHADMDPQKVLVIDAENHPDQTLDTWQQLVGLAARHNHPIERGMLTVLEAWDDEVDLTSQEGQAWLLERIHAYHPALVAMGPLYNMSNRDLKDDETVRKIKSIIGQARSISGSAFLLEHHAPHRGPMDKERSVRPYGSSTFLKFPEFGYGLKPLEQEGAYAWERTRFPRIRTRQFPEAFRWGAPNTDEWFWEPAVIDEETGQVV